MAFVTTSSPFDGGVVNDICWSPDLSIFVAVGQSLDTLQQVATSLDGIAWTQRACPLDIGNGVCWSTDLGKFVAVAEGGAFLVATSPDGVTWTGQTTPWDGVGAARKVAWSTPLNMFCLVGVGDTEAIMTSPDGITWTAQTSGDDTFGASDVVWVDTFAAFFVVGSGPFLVVQSSDGSVWSPNTGPADGEVGLSIDFAVAQGLLIAGTVGSLVTTPDTGTWTAEPSMSGSSWHSVASDGDVNIVVQGTSSGTGDARLKTDVSAWLELATPFDLAGYYGKAAAYSPSLDVWAIGGQTTGSEDAIAYGAPDIPEVITDEATSVLPTSAVLNGRINPAGVDSRGHFEWGETIGYGQQTPSVAIGAGVAFVPISATLNGLSPATVYHFRAVRGGVPIPGDFGANIGPRLPASTGTQYYVATTGSDSTGDGSIGNPWKTIQKAFDSVSLNGSIINVRGGTYVSAGNQTTWSRAGNSGNPVTLRTFPSETAIMNQSRLLVNGGSYLLVDGMEIKDSSAQEDNVKIQGGAHHVEFDHCSVHGAGRQGFLLGASGDNVSNIQIWNTLIFENGGDGPGGLDHGIYAANVTNLTLGSLIIYDNPNGYGVQLYPNVNGALLTACTIDEQLNSVGAGGGCIVIGTESGNVADIQMYGLILTRSYDHNVAFYNASGTFSGNHGYDSLADEGPSPMFETTTGLAYTNCDEGVDPMFVNAGARDYSLDGGSPAIDFGAANPEWLPALDFFGNARVTADIGAIAA